MKTAVFLLLINTTTTHPMIGEFPAGVDAADHLLQAGCLDVTKAPYLADPTGVADSTEAIQRAVNDARDHRLACFFPEGTYLISNIISCEQQVRKLDKPRFVEGGKRADFWHVNHQIVMIGSTKGKKRPILKLSPDAEGFDDPLTPKICVYIWAHSWYGDGMEEKPNISFNHIFKGIDIDVRGHAGAIGIRHSGSQGSTLQDSTIYADGAYAGMNNCCGQGGGTYNIEVLGGRYGIVIEPSSRFPILTACIFKGQTKAAITYSKGGSQVPTLLVGCRIGPAGDCAVDFTTQHAYAGINLVDCVIAMKRGGMVARTAKQENIYIENSYVNGAEFVCSGSPKFPASDSWTHIERYSSHTKQAVNLINGVQSTGEIVEWKPVREVPSFETIRERHYSRGPSFEDEDAVNVKSFGAKADGKTDDTKAFEKAIASHDKIFLPKGNYRLSGTLRLGRNTHLFGFSRTYVSIGSGGLERRRRPDSDEGSAFTIVTEDDAQAAPGLSFLSVRGRIDWKSGRGTYMLAAGPPVLSGYGGGRFYGVMAMGRPFVLRAIRQPTSFYAINVERVLSNPQSIIENCSHIRVYYFKVEAGTIDRPNAGDGNTPCRIANSRDVRICCMYGNVRKLGEHPMLDVANSDGIVVSQLKAFRSGGFPHLTEKRGETQTDIPSEKICALFIRDAKDK